MGSSSILITLRAADTVSVCFDRIRIRVFIKIGSGSKSDFFPDPFNCNPELQPGSSYLGMLRRTEHRSLNASRTDGNHYTHHMRGCSAVLSSLDPNPGLEHYFNFESLDLNPDLVLIPKSKLVFAVQSSNRFRIFQIFS